MRATLPALRPAQRDDLPEVWALLDAEELPGDGVAEHFGPAYVVAETDGLIVGLAGVEAYGAMGLLRSVVVAEGWKGGGLGARLVTDRIEWAKRNGIHELWLLTTTADRWFPRLGFEAADRASVPEALHASAEWGEACPASAVVMRKPL